jgi:hypothetical protein
MNDLPKTFKDAVQVTRALGKQHLWIDALCIIQTIQGEKEGDWKDQAGRMEQAFGSAYCTIAASPAVGRNEGFLERTCTPPRYVQVQDSSGRWVYACDDKDDFTNHVDASPLNQRAWVLQKRVLSRRIIHFTETYTYWECVDGVCCETLKRMNSPLGREYFLLDPKFPERLSQSGYGRTVDFIQFLFEKYAHSGPTKKSDRDIAISGLVKRMESVMEAEGRYGVFARHLYRLLQWVRLGKSTKGISYRDE